MITLKRAGVRGVSARGNFVGEIAFSDGLQVISGRNNYGKSLAATATAWCLGLEPMFGLTRGDPSLFPDAARTALFFPDDQLVDVKSSEAFLEILVSGTRISLTRSIVGGDAKFITASKDGGASVNLVAGGFADETGGFQAALFRWAGWSREVVMTARGAPSPIYIENLAPLFFLEQREGWSDIQGLQLVRYQQLEVSEASVEFLLGLDYRLKSRLARQQSELTEARRKQDFVSWAERVASLLKANGWERALTTKLAVEELESRYREFDLRSFVAEHFNWDFKTEIDRLSSEADGLQKRLNEATGPTSKETAAGAAEASSRVVELKHALHEKREQVEVLRRQIAAQTDLISTTEARLRSAKDLARLKSANVEIFQHAECPTCRSIVEPEKFDLQPQSQIEILGYIESAKRDEEALRAATKDAGGVLQKLLIEISELEQRYALAQRTLRLVSQASNPTAEVVAALAGRILVVEREIEKTRSLDLEIGTLQEELQKWLAGAATAQSKDDKGSVAREKAVVTAFEKTFKEYLAEIGHGDATRLMAQVHLDERYVPRAGARRLRQLGSASDQARLILAYSWALMTTSLQNNGRHPGFLLADEPLQQNPDPAYRAAFTRFVASQAQKAPGQVILLTSLTAADVDFLAGQKVQVVELPQRHLLRPV